MFELMPYGRRRNVTIYNPFQDFENLEKRFFEDMPIAEFKTDISDHGDSYLLEADLPGFEKGDIAIDVEGDVLTIRAERTAKNDEKDKKGNYIKRERSYGSFTRTFDITGIRGEDISAAYENGVLKLTMPKKQAAVPASRRLEIK